MNVFADESVDHPIVTRLRADGHGVVAVAEMSPSISDDEVLTAAVDRGDVLLTADRDFGELVYRRGRTHGGVVLVRLDGLSAGAKALVVSAAFTAHGPLFAGAFTVVAPGQIRVRPGA